MKAKIFLLMMIAGIFLVVNSKLKMNFMHTTTKK